MYPNLSRSSDASSRTLRTSRRASSKGSRATACFSRSGKETRSRFSRLIAPFLPVRPRTKNLLRERVILEWYGPWLSFQFLERQLRAAHVSFFSDGRHRCVGERHQARIP